MRRRSGPIRRRNASWAARPRSRAPVPMLLRSLFTGRASRRGRISFRWRGDGVSRIEGWSDAVFGFAITLVAISLEVPRTAAELLHNAAGLVPCVVSFLVLFFVWRAQFEFFRRYGLE